MTTLEDYISRYEMNAGLIKRLEKGTMLDIKREAFVGDLKSSLRKICGFLGLGYDEDYLEDCASIVLKSPHRSRYDIKWDTTSLAAMREGICRVDFLKSYSFEDR
jgi:hypothetical protein